MKIYARKSKYEEWEVVGSFSERNIKLILKRYQKHFPSYMFKIDF